MSVYVDRVELGYGRLVMCHMIGDSPDDLHAMADRIGVARRWFQTPPKASFWHYDVAKSKRALAVACPICRELPGKACRIEDRKPMVHDARESIAYHGKKIWT